MATKTPAGTFYSSGVRVGPRSKTSYNQATNTYSRDAYQANLNALGNPNARTAEGAMAMAAAYNDAQQPRRPAGPSMAPPPRNNLGSGGGGGGRGGYGGGGGGGGGGVSAAAAAQAQMDYLQSLLGSGAYKVNTGMYDTMRSQIANATAQDQAAAKTAYDNLDAYLASHQSNPYADVKLAQTPGDTSYGAFQNVLALLGANAKENNAMGQRMSQEGRTYAGQQIGAVDNAYLFNVTNQQAQAQQAIDAEKRQALMQMASLIASGAKAPDLNVLGLGWQGDKYDPADPLGWGIIAGLR